jgi:hypothetical protein
MSDPTVLQLNAHRNQVDAQPDVVAQRRAARRLQYIEQGKGSDTRAGFSARLNLLCSLAGERDLGAGRVDDIAALNEKWPLERVRRWLTADEVPPLATLQTLVGFLAARLSTQERALHWEAFLLYGSELVSRPPHHLGTREDTRLMMLAANLLTDIARDHRIAADSYDADAALSKTVETLKSLNVDPDSERGLQEAHRRIVELRVFPRLAELPR